MVPHFFPKEIFIILRVAKKFKKILTYRGFYCKIDVQYMKEV